MISGWTRSFGSLFTAWRLRRVLLLAGLVCAAWSLGSVLTSAVAAPAGSHQPKPTAKATQCLGDIRACPGYRSTQCLGAIHACRGYRYTCVSALYPTQLAVHTDSVKIEDTLESNRYRWHCRGRPDKS